MSTPFVTFVATAHNEKPWNIPLLQSLQAQSNENWKCIVYHNGPNKQLKDFIASIGDDRFEYHESTVDTSTWGTQNRAAALKYLVSTEYVINTSIQDYYLPCTVELISQAVATDAYLIHWQAINHLFNYNIISGELAFGHIDWGQWCIWTESLKKVGIVKGNEFCSDWFTLQEVIKENPTINRYKINLPLTVHN